MRIIIIGYLGLNGYTYNLALSFENLGHQVIVIDIRMVAKFIPPEDFKTCIYMGKPISLKPIEKLYKPNLIFITHTHLNFANDVDTPVWFNMRECSFPPNVLRPDIFSYGHPETRRLYESWFKWDAFNTRTPIFLPTGVMPDYFDVVEKDIEEPIYIGHHNDPEFQTLSINMIFDRFAKQWLSDIPEILHKSKIVKVMDIPVLNEQYKDYMQRAKKMVIYTVPYHILTRRIWEAAICRSMLIIHCFDDFQEDFYRSLGFNETNCIFFRTIKELDSIDLSYDTQKVESAYNLVKNNYTYKHLVKRIIKEFEKYMNELKEFIDKNRDKNETI